MKQRSSILFVLNRFPGIGGIENVTVSLANYLVKKNIFHCSILSVYSQAGITLSTDIDDSIHIYCLNNNVRSCQKKISEIQQHENISIVIYQDSYSPTLFLLDYFDKNKVKIIIVEHNTPNALIRDKVSEFIFEPISSVNNFVRKILFPFIYLKNIIQVKYHHRKAYAIADKYVVLSKSYVPVIHKMVGKEDNKLTYINNPITIPCDTKTLSNSSKCNEVLFVCRLTTQKGTDLILKVWESFSKSHPQWILRIVGDGPERFSMEKWVKKHKINNVKFEGFKMDVVPFYKRAKILCVTSRFEGWGLVIVEGMAYSCVPIAFNSYSAIKDIIDDGINGFIITAYNIDSYVSQMCKIADDIHILKRMQIEARLKTKCFTMENIGSKWVKLLESVTY